MLKVIDVSDWQGNIDWATVKNHIDGAIIRCGWGKDKESQDDAKFHQNVKGCINNNIPFSLREWIIRLSSLTAKKTASSTKRIRDSALLKDVSEILRERSWRKKKLWTLAKMKS